MFLFYLGFIDVLDGRGGLGLVATVKTGPNDARHVVWALGTCFFLLHVLFFSLCVFHFSLRVFRCSLLISPANTRNLAKTTRETRRFGPRYMFKWCFLHFFIFLITYQFI